MTHADFAGWTAAALMVSTFACREARLMRPLAVSANLMFIGYGVLASLAPVLALHLLLLPINLWRWLECCAPLEKPMIALNALRRTRGFVLALTTVFAGCGGGGEGGSGAAPAAPKPPAAPTL
jgi:hypothetical protein